ncbi:Ras-related protein Rab5 [Hibiscus syriacus]|uniref:Ras-related protein Rab5 n=1 Tax=Hibiscus syriacus TaxID=106335 RepID=A0A6A3B083_HIBSY|nr:Ras-related protein Rab5 [Hibiscus syriacus]
MEPCSMWAACPSKGAFRIGVLCTILIPIAKVMVKRLKRTQNGPNEEHITINSLLCADLPTHSISVPSSSGNPNLIMYKVDLEEKGKVGNEEGELYAKENGLTFLETSAKTAHNVNGLFYEIAKRLVKAAPSRPTRMRLHSRPRQSGRMLFCCSS